MNKRQVAQFAKLEQRIADLMTGAGMTFEEDGRVCESFDALGRFLAALRIAFNIDIKDNDDYRVFAFMYWNLGEYKNINNAVKFLFEFGFRA